MDSEGTDSRRIRVGVSACLLGEPVRHDGSHRLDRYVAHTLGQYFEFVPVCPETECGLGVPRESMRLVGEPLAPRLMAPKSDADHTERMLSWARTRLDELENRDLCGFVFKSKSPSSGMERVNVYPEAGGQPRKVGVGLFARAFMERFPLVPAEEEGRLNDPGLRENFIERVFTLRRWREAVNQGLDLAGLVRFHTAHKLLIMAHSPQHYRLMGRLTAEARKYPARELPLRYQSLLMAALSLKATPKKHANVLMHALGYFKKQLSADEKQEMLELIELHRTEVLPLIVPVTLVLHHARRHSREYLLGQWYLRPHPVELKLRNHV